MFGHGECPSEVPKLIACSCEVYERPLHTSLSCVMPSSLVFTADWYESYPAKRHSRVGYMFRPASWLAVVVSITGCQTQNESGASNVASFLLHLDAFHLDSRDRCWKHRLASWSDLYIQISDQEHLLSGYQPAFARQLTPPMD